MENSERNAKKWMKDNSYLDEYITKDTVRMMVSYAGDCELNDSAGWIDVNDRTKPMIANTDFLIKLEDGQIFRNNEDWSDEMQIVTHWKPF